MADDDGTAGIFPAAMLSLVLVPTSIVWCCRVKSASSRGDRPGQPSALGLAILTAVVLGGWALVVHLGSSAAGGASKFDPFDVLGVDESATDREIKKAYRQLSLVHHPDKGGDEEAFREVNAAYRALTDPEARENWLKYGDPDGKPNFGFDMGVALPAFMFDQQNQGAMLLLYMTVLIGAPAFCFFGGGLRRRGAPAGALAEAQKQLLEHFEAELGSEGAEETLLSLLRHIAGAPPLLPAEPPADSEPEAAGADDAAAAAAIEACLASVKPAARRSQIEQQLEGCEPEHRLNLALLVAHLAGHSVAKDGQRSQGEALEALSADHRARLQLLLAALPQVIQALLRLCALQQSFPAAKMVLSLSQGLSLGIWPPTAKSADDCKTVQKRLLKAHSATLPSALVDARAGVEGEESIVEGDVVTCQLVFKRQNNGFPVQPILTGRPLPEEPSSEALQALLARAPGAHALALEAAARQKKVPESWVVLVGSPQSEELRGMWPLNGPPSAPRAAQAAVQWEQKEVGRNRLTVVAGSLNYFAECDKSKSDEEASRICAHSCSSITRKVPSVLTYTCLSEADVVQEEEEDGDSD